jgi:hypothetical protein
LRRKKLWKMRCIFCMPWKGHGSIRKLHNPPQSSSDSLIRNGLLNGFELRNRVLQTQGLSDDSCSRIR